MRHFKAWVVPPLQSTHGHEAFIVSTRTQNRGDNFSNNKLSKLLAATKNTKSHEKKLAESGQGLLRFFVLFVANMSNITHGQRMRQT